MSALLGKPTEGFVFEMARHKHPGDLVPTCQPVQIAELAKKETENDLSNDTQKHLHWCGCFHSMCASHCSGRKSNAGARLSITD
jgi:hypothetical protein